jgi:uncharacterized protein YcfJ
MKTNTIVAIGAGALLLVAATAGASVYLMENNDPEEKANTSTTRVSTQETIHYNQPRQAQAPQPACDDDNIVGKVVGGAGGGLAGSQIGSGSGKTAATIAGAVGGTLLGEEYIPTKNVTCR